MRKENLVNERKYKKQIKIKGGRKMLARKCDRCGAFYDNYTTESGIETDEYEVACLRACPTHSRQMPENEPLDLCPDCMDEFFKWFNN